MDTGADDDSRGLIPRSIEQIFAARDSAAAAAAETRGAGAQPPSLAITATMIEIYNEDIKDLLGGGASSKVRRCKLILVEPRVGSVWFQLLEVQHVEVLPNDGIRLTMRLYASAAVKHEVKHEPSGRTTVTDLKTVEVKNAEQARAPLLIST